MILTPDQMNAIKGLVHYLNESFDGHGLGANITLVGLEEDAGIPEPLKGEIRAIEREEDENGRPMLNYAWGYDV